MLKCGWHRMREVTPIFRFIHSPDRRQDWADELDQVQLPAELIPGALKAPGRQEVSARKSLQIAVSRSDPPILSFQLLLLQPFEIPCGPTPCNGSHLQKKTPPTSRWKSVSGMSPSRQCLHLTLLKRFSIAPVRKDSTASSSCASLPACQAEESQRLRRGTESHEGHNVTEMLEA